MENPKISVVMATAQKNFPMIGFPDQDFFSYVIQALQRQTFRDFEFIISDYHFSTREFDFNRIGHPSFPVYRVPITHSLAHKMGYCAMSASRNAGIMFASAPFLVMLDDCGIFEAKYLERIYTYWQQLGTFPSSLFMIEQGTDSYKDKDGKEVKDDRFGILEASGHDVLINGSNMYSYSSMSTEAILRINGYPEDHDFSFGLDDIDTGQRLMKAGYKISIHKNLIVKEQKHVRTPNSEEDMPDGSFHFKQHLFCSGPIVFLKLETRTGEDYIQANRRQYTEEEKAILMEKPCHYSHISPEGVTICKGSRLPCDWDRYVSKEKQHMELSGTETYLNNLPVFDLGQEREKRLADKEKYRVR